MFFNSAIFKHKFTQRPIEMDDFNVSITIIQVVLKLAGKLMSLW